MEENKWAKTQENQRRTTTMPTTRNINEVASHVDVKYAWVYVLRGRTLNKHVSILATRGSLVALLGRNVMTVY